VGQLCLSAIKQVLIMKLKQYDTVKLIGLHVPTPLLADAFNLRQPVIGDVAAIVEVYSNPSGYELECSDRNGITQWLMAFRPDDIELELHRIFLDEI